LPEQHAGNQALQGRPVDMPARQPAAPHRTAAIEHGQQRHATRHRHEQGQRAAGKQRRAEADQCEHRVGGRNGEHRKCQAAWLRQQVGKRIEVAHGVRLRGVMASILDAAQV